MGVTIKVKPEQIREDVRKIREIHNQHDAIVKKITNEVHNFGDAWKGDAQKEFSSSYDDMQKAFRNFSDMIEKIAKTMEGAALAAELKDKNLASGINNNLSKQ